VTSELPAGDFTTWLGQIGSALTGDGVSDVPCGPCTACCRSRQFVHVGPDETQALAAIPADLLFAAPGLPVGTMVLGYDQDGRCPMLGTAGCTIYASRPRTCRVYDCRVFAATGIPMDEPGNEAIGEQASRWRFTVASESDQEHLDALRATGADLSRDRSTQGLPATARALAALRVVVDPQSEVLPRT